MNACPPKAAHTAMFAALVLALSCHTVGASSRKLSHGGKCADTWEQCGGARDWKGPSCCRDGDTCKPVKGREEDCDGEPYKRCEPDCDHQDEGCAPLGGQCGGFGFQGPSCCKDGGVCKDQYINGVRNIFYRKCLPDENDGKCSDWFGQCGGIGWRGPQCCKTGSVCRAHYHDGEKGSCSECTPDDEDAGCAIDKQGPIVDSISPAAGCPGTLITVYGRNFAPAHYDNAVTVGGRPALVVSATTTELQVISDLEISDAQSVVVTAKGRAGRSSQRFSVLGFPNPGTGDDGPPISFGGAGAGASGDVNPIGTIRILVSLVRPSDRTPGAGERAAVQAAWDDVRTFYTQASYGRTTVQVDITANWAVLDGTEADFLDGDNINWALIDRFTAQAAQGAVNEGFNLNDYDMMATVCSLGSFIRAWGGYSRQSFEYTNAAATPPISISLAADHSISQIAISQNADWGRCAHETGHNLVSAPSFTGDGTATLGEDIYSSDLVDGSAATAAPFDLMGNHDSHPLFSGYHMSKLGYYNAHNIATAAWDRNPFSKTFDVVAHGLAEDATADRVHLVVIKVTEGLSYYVQVRQRPSAKGLAASQVFDGSIPLPAGGAPANGGVIVTRAISDTLNINQQTRFITLMHGQAVLTKGDFVEDPARALKITVEDIVQRRPLVYRVRVEWAQTIADDPNGAFDLYVLPWDSGYQTPDIWVDRDPFGTFDQPLDAEGRPTGNGDKPMTGKINKLFGRVHVRGPAGATNVKATLYSIFPPGVGDNGNWAPLGTQTISSIAADSFADVTQNWVPVVGQHTCLKLYASAQLGEVTAGNNFAQENVFDFIAKASSPPWPVKIRVAVRNPLDARAIVRVAVKGVPERWRVHFPHSWVWLDGKAEKHFDLTVVPMFDWNELTGCAHPPLDMLVPDATASVRLEGILPRSYDTPLPPQSQPAGSRAYPIGGILSRVGARKVTYLSIEEGLLPGSNLTGSYLPNVTLAVRGRIGERIAGQRVRVECTHPSGLDLVTEVLTNGDGAFDALFDLAVESRTEVPSKVVASGTYHVVASVFDATLVAEVDSNELNVYISGVFAATPSPPPPPREVVIKR